MADLIKLKRGQSASWTRLNPILEPGEPGFEMDTGRLKIGNGLTPWNELVYVGETDVVNAATHYEFPSIGRPNAIYKAEEERKIYQWNSTSLVYELINEEVSLDSVEIINGGNANGTN